ncbi:Ribosome biogenesis protein wdr12 [Tupaia chinensis]|uniref:Ribosome biogenesis protein wdr12 n=1 Tax=Tupaia chinensis TaxID=246437 RepID=L9JDL6_TUPCH|nr:Ribosome biogenesis protein wdr12 [Tupaia chinensis]
MVGITSKLRGRWTYLACFLRLPVGIINHRPTVSLTQTCKAPAVTLLSGTRLGPGAARFELCVLTNHSHSPLLQVYMVLWYPFDWGGAAAGVELNASLGCKEGNAGEKEGPGAEGVCSGRAWQAGTAAAGPHLVSVQTQSRGPGKAVDDPKLDGRSCSSSLTGPLTTLHLQLQEAGWPQTCCQPWAGTAVSRVTEVTLTIFWPSNDCGPQSSHRNADGSTRLCGQVCVLCLAVAQLQTRVYADKERHAAEVPFSAPAHLSDTVSQLLEARHGARRCGCDFLSEGSLPTPLVRLMELENISPHEVELDYVEE